LINYIKKELNNSGGIYDFLYKNYNKIYISSSENLVKRFLKYIKGGKSNIKLERAVF
jgi:excinuclease UvrABC nuclease subunit